MNRTDRLWESLGIVAGLGTCVAIAVQAWRAWSGPPLLLSPIYLGTLLAVFAFWTAYGWRFRRMALWLTNGLALILHTSLCVACWR